MSSSRSINDCKDHVMVELGRGSFSVVTCQRDVDNGALVAVKSYKRELHRDRAARIFAEREALERMESPYIIQLLGTWKDEECIYFRMEAVLGGPLHRHISTAHFGYAQAIGYSAELVSCILHMVTF